MPKKARKVSQDSLSATNLKNELWDTLQGIKNGDVLPGHADSIASISREIIRTSNLQLRIAAQSQRNVPIEVINFSEQ